MLKHIIDSFYGKTKKKDLSDFKDPEAAILIPTIIEQMKLKRITNAEQSILSEIFGPKYWKLILEEVNRLPTDSNGMSNILKDVIIHSKKQLRPEGIKRTKRTPITALKKYLNGIRLERNLRDLAIVNISRG